MTLKASELIKLLQNHIEKHGDEDVLILDEYNDIYKQISPRSINSNGKQFVIEHECNCL